MTTIPKKLRQWADELDASPRGEYESMAHDMRKAADELETQPIFHYAGQGGFQIVIEKDGKPISCTSEPKAKV